MNMNINHKDRSSEKVESNSPKYFTVFVVRILTTWFLLMGMLAEGTVSGQFLKNAESSFQATLLPPDARGAGMGETGTALADDVSSIYWNPAGLGGLTGFELGLSGNSYLDGMSLVHILAAIPAGKIGIFGFRANFAFSGDIGLFSQGVPQGTDTASHVSVTFAYGKDLSSVINLGKAFLVGGGLNIYSESLPGLTSTRVKGLNFAIDVGILIREIVGRLSVGVKFKNLGPKTMFRGSTEATSKAGSPADFGIGLGYDFSFASDEYSVHLLRVLVDFDYLPGENPLYNLGLEWKKGVGSRIDIAVRAGILGAKFSDPGLPLAFGAGFAGGPIALDYAFASFADLGSTHRVSLTYRYKGVARKVSRAVLEARKEKELVKAIQKEKDRVRKETEKKEAEKKTGFSKDDDGFELEDNSSSKKKETKPPPKKDSFKSDFE